MFDLDREAEFVIIISSDEEDYDDVSVADDVSGYDADVEPESDDGSVADDEEEDVDADDDSIIIISDSEDSKGEGDVDDDAVIIISDSAEKNKEESGVVVDDIIMIDTDWGVQKH